MSAAPLDSFERRIDYLRLSVTDRCNLRCTYCVPEDGVEKLEHEELLRYEEVLRLARIAVAMGISKIRITGGEPLVRRDILYLCREIAALPGVKNLSMTTNGVLLDKFAAPLLQAGLRRINISLDTLRPEKFLSISRRNHFQDVWRGIHSALAAGLSPVKINVVVMHGVNDDEIEDLGRLSVYHPFEIRFIEFMPFQPESGQGQFVSADEILARLGKIGPLIPSTSTNGNGPARHFRFPGARGRVGVISPISNHFCGSCNRLRLTSDGKLRTCLFSVDETDLKSPLRAGATDEELTSIIRSAIAAKPERHRLEGAAFRKCISRPMVAIGG